MFLFNNNKNFFVMEPVKKALGRGWKGKQGQDV